jgi:hypothetical protein
MSERFAIPINGDPNIRFYSKRDLPLAIGYSRIVIGKRGPYIEFEPDQIIHENIYVPPYAQHKLESNLTYYHEYRSKDECNVKLYFQIMRVTYADYKVGKWYIDPNSLKTEQFDSLMLPIYYEDTKIEASGLTIFDL